jgi:sugar phosphate isomerase/epimerase
MTPRLFFCHTLFGKDTARIGDYRVTHGYEGVEWGLDGWRLMKPEGRRRELLDRWRTAAPRCSIHAPYTDLEIGHRDPEHAGAACRILQDYVDAAADLGAHHVNIHVGTFSPEPEELCHETLARNLTILMEHARRRGVPLTVENLRGGPSSDPESFAAILRRTGVPVTFDLGHARGCPWVLEGRGTVVDFIRAIPTPILSGHVYFIERDDTHFAPATLADLAPALDALTERGCDVWVLELHTLETLQRTRQIVDQYLRERGESARA